MIEFYADSKKYLLNFINEIEKSPLIDRNILTNSTLLNEVERLENGEFKIALVAPFSAGKSTFINSIIGKDLLSMEITAETSVITKINFSNDIRLEVNYRHTNKVETIDRDEAGRQLTYDSCKEILKKITTVYDEKNEEDIQQVVVYLPLDICRDNVELIDTPGLFSRHAKHEAITNNILPQVNAVIFMIAPDSVGEEHFTETIRRYVQEAASSSLEEDGRHIFFVINKIDMFNATDILNARNELGIVLSGIISNPNIHEVSSYLGMRGKQMMNQDIDLSLVRKDRNVRIPDPEDPEYMISGRQILEEHAHDIIKYSRIRGVEKSLGEYLQSKNKYLITDVISTIRSIISDSINKLKFEIQEIQSSMQTDNSEYIGKIDLLKMEIDSLRDSTTKKIQSLVDNRILGNITDASLEKELDRRIRDASTDISKDVEREIYRKWAKAKTAITRDNAESQINAIIFEAEEYIVLKIKEIVRQSFLFIKQVTTNLIADVQVQFDEIMQKLEEAEVKKLGSKMERIGNLNVENLIGKTMNKVEAIFADNIVKISKSMQGKLSANDANATYMERKRGFWNAIKDWFGAAEMEEKFDMLKFKRSLEVTVNEMSDSMRDEVLRSQVVLIKPISDSLEDITADINNEVSQVIRNVVSIKQGVLNSLKKDMSKNEDEKKSSIREKQQSIKGLNEIENRFDHRIEQLMEGGAEIGRTEAGARYH